MPYALRSDEDLAAGLRRVAGEQAKRGIASLQAALDHPPDDVDVEAEDPWDEGVHDARKRCKKIRAVARLCRDELGDAYAEVNATFRDAARLLSDARDAWTLIETTDRLVAVDEDELIPSEVADELRTALVVRYRRVREQTVATGRVTQAVDALTAGAEAIEDWPLSPDLSAAALRPSLKRVYKRGRRAWRAVEDTVEGDPHATTEQWHEWRKRVKYLWYHVRLLEEAWPDLLGAVADDLDDLADDLGDDHDLGVLVEVVTEAAGKAGEGQARLLGPGMAQQIAGAAAVQRHVLRREAAQVAPRVYAEAPSAFADRMTAYLEMRSDR